MTEQESPGTGEKMVGIEAPADGTPATLTQDPVVATYAANIVIRGDHDWSPTIAELEAAVEKAVQDLGGVSRANRPLTTVNVTATRTDR